VFQQHYFSYNVIVSTQYFLYKTEDYVVKLFVFLTIEKGDGNASFAVIIDFMTVVVNKEITD
jgi:hypothetical protein